MEASGTGRLDRIGSPSLSSKSIISVLERGSVELTRPISPGNNQWTLA
jgi:hypothetical protein